MLNDISDEAPIDEDEQTTTDVDYADLGDQLTDEVLAVLTLMPEELDLDLDNITKGWIWNIFTVNNQAGCVYVLNYVLTKGVIFSFRDEDTKKPFSFNLLVVRIVGRVLRVY